MLATGFLREFHATGNYRRDFIERLATLATSSDEETAKAATGAVFASIVERLADSFEPSAVTLYNRLFAQLIQFCRQSPQGRALDEELRRFGLDSEGDFVTRAEQLRHVRRRNRDGEPDRFVKRVLVLSRVTIGADVAITSLIIARLKSEFPDADIVLVGNPKAAELFGGDPRICFAEVRYRRAGTLTERLLTWLEVLHCVRSSIDGLRDEEYLIVDPDSRLTQLGLLPLLTPAAPYTDTAPSGKARLRDNYVFFPSREFGNTSTDSLSRLTLLWLKVVFADGAYATPLLGLRDEDLGWAAGLVNRMRRCDTRPVVAVNFGVGENPLKRVSDEFEKQLICRLLEEGAKIILDKGAGEAELKRADTVIRKAKRIAYQGRAVKVVEVDETRIENLLQADTIDADVFVWNGRIGLLAALISKSDLYVGYDSAGQHIATALGVPCIDVFAGYSSPRMLDRWRPMGTAEARVIPFDTLGGAANEAAVLEETLACVRDVLK